MAHSHPSELLSGNAASNSLSYLYIPDMLKDWPWQRKLNPLYEEISAEGEAWFWTFKLPFNSKSQQAFEACKFGLCAALMYPDVPAEQLRTGVDLMNVYFLIDEYTDVEQAPRVREIVDICVDALYNPSKPRPDGEVIIGEVVRQFWKRGQDTVTQHDGSGDRFIASFVEYLDGVVAHAEARDRGVAILTPKAQQAIRLKDVGVLPLYALWAAFHSIPDHLFNNPLYVRMASLSCEIIGIDNDFVSYNREQASGDVDFNIITIIMHHNGFNLHDAACSLIQRNAELATEYLQCYQELCASLQEQGDPEANETSVIRRYLAHMGNVRRANWCWSFECSRYFGDRGLAYVDTQMVPLVPKLTRDRDLVREDQVDVIMMEEELTKL